MLFAGFVGLNAIAFVQAYRMLHFAQAGVRTRAPEQLSRWERVPVLLFGVNHPRPMTEPLPAAVAANYQHFMIPGPGAIRLGALYAAVGDEKRIVLLFHGFGAEKSSLLHESEAFREMGYSTLLVDFRGAGESSESYSTIGYAEGDDVAAAVDWVRERHPDSRLVLFGQSMGAAAILRAVHAHGTKADAIILESVFDGMLNTVCNRFRTIGVPSFPAAELMVFWGGVQFGFNGFAHNPATYARRVACPTLFLHGTADPRARMADAECVFDAVTAEKMMVPFDGARHEGLLKHSPTLWKDSVRAFLRQHLPT